MWDEEPHPPTPSPHAGRGSQREFLRSWKKASGRKQLLAELPSTVQRQNRKVSRCVGEIQLWTNTLCSPCLFSLSPPPRERGGGWGVGAPKDFKSYGRNAHTSCTTPHSTLALMQIRRRPPNPAVAVEYLRYQVKLPDSEPQHILEEIVWHKETEVAQMRERLPLPELQRQVQDAPAPRDFLGALQQGKTSPAIIAEVKKASPSKGVIRADFDPVAIAKAYQLGGASCISVLTDEKFFQGSFENLAAVRAAVDLPVLCKDFLIYPYQIYLARARGADAVLLIASILPDKDIQYFVKIVKGLGMVPLIEVHTLEEMQRVLGIEGVTLVGINNRNLEDFSVDLQTTVGLLGALGDRLRERGILVVSESGLHSPDDLSLVAGAGAGAVLVGESLVKQPDIAGAVAQLCAGEAKL